MGHESQIELWSPKLTTFCFAGFGTNRFRCQEAMKTAGRENPKRWDLVPSNRAHGAVGQNNSRSIKWAAKQEKFQPKEKCFFLTSTFIELIRSYLDGISRLLYSASLDMEKTALSKGALVVCAVVSLSVLTWLVSQYRTPSQRFGLTLSIVGLLVAAYGVALLWSAMIGNWSRIRLWSPQWTFLAGAAPFYLLGFWVFFFSGLEMRLSGYLRMLIMVCVGSASGRQARKKAYPQFSDEDAPSTPLPPPTLFPK